MDARESGLVTEPAEIKKGEFVDMLLNLKEGDEISWLSTDAYSFEWSEINLRWGEFVDRVRKLDFKTACMSVTSEGKDGTKYSSFRIAA